MAHPHRGPDEALPDLPVYLHLRGGCAPEAQRNHGSYFRENCGESKEIFAFVAPRVVGKKWEETKALKSRSLTRG